MSDAHNVLAAVNDSTRFMGQLTQLETNKRARAVELAEEERKAKESLEVQMGVLQDQFTRLNLQKNELTQANLTLLETAKASEATISKLQADIETITQQKTVIVEQTSVASRELENTKKTLEETKSLMQALMLYQKQDFEWIINEYLSYSRSVWIAISTNAELNSGQLHSNIQQIVAMNADLKAVLTKAFESINAIVTKFIRDKKAIQILYQVSMIVLREGHIPDFKRQLQVEVFPEVSLLINDPEGQRTRYVPICLYCLCVARKAFSGDAERERFNMTTQKILENFSIRDQ